MISSDGEITLEAKNLRSIIVSIRQGDREIELLRDVTDSNEKSYTIHINTKELQLKEGRQQSVSLQSPASLRMSHMR